MSGAYYDKFGDAVISKEEMRKWCQRPGKHDEDGKIIYTTEQAHKNQCDINKIVARFDRDGIITHVSKFEGRFGDLSGTDFKQMQDQVAGAKTMFEALPSGLRARFDNDPVNLLSFMDDEENRQEAIDLGMIREEWTDESDGLGEHVPEGENVKKEPEKAV